LVPAAKTLENQSKITQNQSKLANPIKTLTSTKTQRSPHTQTFATNQKQASTTKEDQRPLDVNTETHQRGSQNVRLSRARGTISQSSVKQEEDCAEIRISCVC
jgi:hypothetical protein